MRKLANAIVAFGCIALLGQSAAGQSRGGGAFSVGYTDIGPVIGLGGLGGANISIGGRFEHGFKALPDLANGVLGIEAGFDYYSYSNSSFSVKYSPIGVTLNYHFKLDEPKIDPFVGVGLGYEIINCTNTVSAGDHCGNSDLYLIARAGARYFYAPNMAFYGDIGAGAATLNLGLMFKVQ